MRCTQDGGITPVDKPIKANSANIITRMAMLMLLKNLNGMFCVSKVFVHTCRRTTASACARAVHETTRKLLIQPTTCMSSRVCASEHALNLQQHGYSAHCLCQPSFIFQALSIRTPTAIMDKIIFATFCFTMLVVGGVKGRQLLEPVAPATNQPLLLGTMHGNHPHCEACFPTQPTSRQIATFKAASM